MTHDSTHPAMQLLRGLLLASLGIAGTASAVSHPTTARNDYRCLHTVVRRDETIVVLGGAIEIGTRTLAAGSFIRLRADEWRSLSTQSGATLQIFGDGPFELSTGAEK